MLLFIESVLKKQSGVLSVKVSFASENAFVEYVFSKLERNDLEKVIEKTGYKVIKKVGQKNILDLKIIGMDNSHCLSTVKGALNSLKGIVSKELFVNERAKIEFDPQILDAKTIKEVIKTAGYTAN